MAELEIKPTPGMRIRVFSLIAAASTLTVVLMYLLVGGGSDILAPRTTLNTYMPDVTGLVTGSEVRLSGIRIGKVAAVEISDQLDPQRAVHVQMKVLTRYLRGIPVDSRTDITADTLVGNQFVDITEGKSPVPIGEDGTLQSEPVVVAQDRADLIRSVQDRLKQVDSILAHVTSGQSGLGQVIVHDQEYRQLLSGVTDFEAGIHSFITPENQLGKSLYSVELYRQLQDPLVQIDQVLTDIQAGRGAAGQLVASDAQYNSILSQLKNLRAALADMNAGKGQWGAYLLDDGSYQRIAKLLKTTDQTIATLTGGDGQFAHLLSSPQLYESLNGSLRDMEDLLRDLREHPRKYLRYKVF